MTLLAEVVARLEESAVAHCLIGAAALAVRGAPRSTLDDDVLVVDPAVLNAGFWGPLQPDVSRSMRGDHDDPLAGAVRLVRSGERSVDVVVGRWRWQRDVIERATLGAVPGVSLRVASPADLVLLKLDADGPQDHHDVQTLLATHGAELVAEVEGLLVDVPVHLQEAWARTRA